MADSLGAVPRKLGEGLFGADDHQTAFILVCFMAFCGCIFLCRPRFLRGLLRYISGSNHGRVGDRAEWKGMFMACSKPSQSFGPRTPKPPASRPEVTPPPPSFSSRKPVSLTQIRRFLASQPTSERVEELSPVHSVPVQSHRQCVGPRSAATAQSVALPPRARITRSNPSHAVHLAWLPQHQDELSPPPPNVVTSVSQVGKTNMAQATPRLLGQEHALSVRSLKSDKTSQSHRSERRQKSAPNLPKVSTLASPRPPKGSPRFPHASPRPSHGVHKPKKVVTFGSVETVSIAAVKQQLYQYSASFDDIV